MKVSYYGYANSYLFIYGQKIHKFTAKHKSPEDILSVKTL